MKKLGITLALLMISVNGLASGGSGSKNEATFDKPVQTTTVPTEQLTTSEIPVGHFHGRTYTREFVDNNRNIDIFIRRLQTQAGTVTYLGLIIEDHHQGVAAGSLYKITLDRTGQMWWVPILQKNIMGYGVLGLDAEGYPLYRGGVLGGKLILRPANLEREDLTNGRVQPLQMGCHNIEAHLSNKKEWKPDLTLVLQTEGMQYKSDNAHSYLNFLSAKGARAELKFQGSQTRETEGDFLVDTSFPGIFSLKKTFVAPRKASGIKQDETMRALLVAIKKPAWFQKDKEETHIYAIEQLRDPRTDALMPTISCTHKMTEMEPGIERRERKHEPK